MTESSDKRRRSRSHMSPEEYAAAKLAHQTKKAQELGITLEEYHELKSKYKAEKGEGKGSRSPSPTLSHKEHHRRHHQRRRREQSEGSASPKPEAGTGRRHSTHRVYENATPEGAVSGAVPAVVVPPSKISPPPAKDADVTPLRRLFSLRGVFNILLGAAGYYAFYHVGPHTIWLFSFFVTYTAWFVYPFMGFGPLISCIAFVVSHNYEHWVYHWELIAAGSFVIFVIRFAITGRNVFVENVLGVRDLYRWWLRRRKEVAERMEEAARKKKEEEDKLAEEEREKKEAEERRKRNVSRMGYQSELIEVL